MTKEALLAGLQAQIATRAKLEGTLQGAIAPEVLACGEDWVELRFPAADWMRNPYGILHGGMAATMLDTAMGILSCALSGGVPVTVSMSLNYVQPILLDRPICVTAHCQHCGRSIAYLTAEAWQTRGESCVTASGAFYVSGLSGTPAASSCSGETSSADTAEIS